MQSGMNEIHASLRQLERRDWRLWCLAIFIMLLLTGAVISLSLHLLITAQDGDFSFNLARNVRGLLGLVLVFSVYAIYQQILIKRLRSQLASQIGATANLELLAEESQKRAMADPLTGLANRRLAEGRLAAEVARSHRHKHPLTVVSFDLNDFKQINDRFGHGAGDLVLREFADRLKRAIRNSDLAARMGGDEFMLILPECAPGQVQSVLARLNDMAVTWHGQEIPFSSSVGWSEYQLHESLEQFIERADRVLYEDKRSRKGSTHSTTVRSQSTGQTKASD